MNKPKVFTYLIGNPLSVLALLGLSGYLVYLWFGYNGNASVLFLIAPAAITSAALKASSQLITYRNWSREWEQLSGDKSAARVYLKGLEPWRIKILIGVAIVSGYFVIDSNADLHQPATWVLGLCVVCFLVAIIRWIRHIFGRFQFGKSKVRAGKEYIVEQCLPPFKNSPRPLQAVHALPPYAKSLIPHKIS